MAPKALWLMVVSLSRAYGTPEQDPFVVLESSLHEVQRILERHPEQPLRRC